MAEEEGSSGPLFSCGIHLADLAVASNLPYHAWESITRLQAGTEFKERNDSSVSIRYGEFRVESFKIIAFVTSPVTDQFLLEKEDCAPLSDVPEFAFLCPVMDRDSEICLNGRAVSLFRRVCNELSVLKAQIEESANSNSTSYLITGNGLGGSVASLFTLWLLEKLSPTSSRRPLCITFGSPLVGDSNLQRVISLYPIWESCFLHMVHKDNGLPSSFWDPRSIYRPFGTFLLFSESGCACFEASESILQLLQGMRPEGIWNQELTEGFQYKDVVQRLRDGVSRRDTAMLGGSETESFEIGIMVQLAALGLLQNQLSSWWWQHQNNGRDSWILQEIVEPEKKAMARKRRPSNQAKELNDLKVFMAYLEWYRKSETGELGYYDGYKRKGFYRDHRVVEYKQRLKKYWKRVVEEAEKKPQKEEAPLRTRWLLAGTNFRRMIEPLDIAEYYSAGKSDYLTEGRSKCYTMLEEWFKGSGKPEMSLSARKESIQSSLTEDSCFWARVEEAIISCERLRCGRMSAVQELAEFELYVIGLIDKYLVSPEIFLSNSTYMKWWEEYDRDILGTGLMGAQHDSELIRYMRKAWYRQYVTQRRSSIE